MVHPNCDGEIWRKAMVEADGPPGASCWGLLESRQHHRDSEEAIDQDEVGFFIPFHVLADTFEGANDLGDKLRVKGPQAPVDFNELEIAIGCVANEMIRPHQAAETMPIDGTGRHAL